VAPQNLYFAAIGLIGVSGNGTGVNGV